MNTFWPACLSQFEKELPAQQFITWIKPLSVQSNGASALTIVAPNRFVLQWIRDKFFTRIQELALMHFGHRIDIDLLLGEKESPATTPKSLLPETILPN